MKITQKDDLAGQNFWDDAWKDRELPYPVDPSRTELDFHIDLKFHDYFSKILKPFAGAKLFEVGCAGSRWLPYFAQHHGYAVEGLDYSPTGCDQAKEMLRRADVEGLIHQGNL